MQRSSAHIASRLLLQHLQGMLSVEEQGQLDAWIHADPVNQQLFDQINSPQGLQALLTGYHQRQEAMDRQLATRIPGITLTTTSGKIKEIRDKYVRSAHRMHFLKTSWVRYAAAILILLTGFSVYLYYPEKQHIEEATVAPARVLQDALPGSNKAILTLADGQQITLDNTANALLTGKGITNNNALVSYSGKGIPDVINTLSTPKGGQYQLRLPDETMVWLNAASSITYPTSFTGQNRKVSITGEAYFEVSRNKEKPFIVQLNNQRIQVLGTHFNVNAYADEEVVQTTLLEGRVEVSGNGYSRILKPGQQSLSMNNGIDVNTNINSEQVIAWKNGEFNFNNRTFAEVMRQLSRWYDVEVVYEGMVPDLEFGGEMGRDLNLSQVLKALMVMGVRFRIEGKKLIVIS